MTTPEPLDRRQPAARRASRRTTSLALSVGIVVGALVVLLFGGRRATTGTGDDWAPERVVAERFKPEDREFALDYAFGEEPWAEEVLRDRDRIEGEVDPVVGWRLRDGAGKYVNVQDGRRVTYQPPNPTVTVWYFGGSTMFGSSQRDDHTIPSVIARLAEADGIALRSVNFGVESYNNYQETLAFAAELSLGERPDLVVFYDGANEIASAVERIEVGRLDPEEIYVQAVTSAERAKRGASATAAKMSEEERSAAIVELAARQYGRGVALARDLAAGAGVPVVHVWQPEFATTTPQPFSEPVRDRLGLDAAGLAAVGDIYRSVLERSGTSAIDLLDALSVADRPTFFDFEHTNELGARLVAERLYEMLEPQLAELSR